MGNFASLLPGARVRAGESIAGTVERLEYLDADRGQQPDFMVVRSEDGRWRYHLPVLLVNGVTQGTFYTVINLTIGPDELVHYRAEEIDQATANRQTAAELPVGEWTPDDQAATLRIPLAAEELTAFKQPIELGMVHVHKGVETIEQAMDVPLYHEEAIVEHIPPDQYDGSAPANPNEVIIPIVEERLVVEKKTFIKEYIRVRKNVVTAHQEVRDTVRRETLEVTERRQDGAGAHAAPLVRDASRGSGNGNVATPAEAP